ncbi:adenosine-specific kinase [Cuniculiplasma sp. SKW4]|uniref:adenosine-specific kinase n=1 Tax=Cuniculiplasma sp. SKW4 TaxID=3400171 RepID=UPI003FD43BDD
MEHIESVKIDFPDGCNVILGYSHFIKTVEDLVEIVRTSRPDAIYAVAFSEASGERLIRYEGNDKDLINYAISNIKNIGAGHTFLIILKNVFPIAILNQIKQCQEVGRIFAATANPLEVIVIRKEDRAGILGVIDGFSPLGIENDQDKEKRKELLRRIGYKN